MIREVLDRVRTRVTDNGSIYTEMGANRFDGLLGQWVNCTDTISDGTGDDKYVAPETPIEFRFRDNGVIRMREQGTSTWYRVKPINVVTSPDTPTKTWTSLISSTDSVVVKNGNGREFTSTTFGNAVTIKSLVTRNGLKQRHIFRPAVPENPNCDAIIGIRYRMSDPGVLPLLKADPMCTIEQVSDTHFVEWFPRSTMWNEETQQYERFVHYYTTIGGGALGADTQLTAGTYHFTGGLTLGSYDLSDDRSGGDIIIKADSGLGVLLDVSGTGQLLLNDGSSSARLYVTSKNDDTIGETISGSTGSPACGDIDHVAMVTSTSATTVDCNWMQIRYADATNTALLSWTGSNSSHSLTFENIAIRNCCVNTTTGGSVASFIGRGNNGTPVIGSLSLSNIDINDTCNAMEGAGSEYVMSITDVPTTATTITAYLKPTGSFLGGIYIESSGVATGNVSVKNAVIEMSAAATTRGVIGFRSKYIGTSTALVDGCVLTNTSSAVGVAVSVSSNNASALWTATVRNTILLDNDGSSGDALESDGKAHTITHTHNDYYGNTSNCFEALTASEKTVDPQLGNIFGGTIADGFAIPNGYSSGNTDLQEAGSDTYDNLGIDETEFSPDGIQKSGTDTVWIGINYQMDPFWTESVTQVQRDRIIAAAYIGI